MNKKVILSTLLVFLLGWFSGSIFNVYATNHNIGIEKIHAKFSDLYYKDLMKSENLEKLDVNKKLKDKPSPNNWVNRDKIFVYDDGVVIKVKKPQWAVFTDTKSMDPVIDSTSKAIEVSPKSEDDIHIGDIVAYKSKYKDGIVTHRIVDIGYDSYGWYVRLKGDNNENLDPEKVRFNQIKGVVVAVIY